MSLQIGIAGGAYSPYFYLPIKEAELDEETYHGAIALVKALALAAKPSSLHLASSEKNEQIKPSYCICQLKSNQEVRLTVRLAPVA